jgi:hypothetical protein
MRLVIKIDPLSDEGKAIPNSRAERIDYENLFLELYQNHPYILFVIEEG